MEIKNKKAIEPRQRKTERESGLKRRTVETKRGEPVFKTSERIKNIDIGGRRR